MAASMARNGRSQRSLVSVCAVALLMVWAGRSSLAALSFAAQAPRSTGVASRQRGPAGAGTARAAGVADSIRNPVKTVSDSISDFYKAYPVPPVLPMYRSFIIDFLTNVHLAVYDSRFKYDAVFALGLKEYYSGLMGSYDKIVGGQQSEKIWLALVQAVGLEPETVDGDAAAAASYGSSTSPAEILKDLEGSESASDAKVTGSFKSIRSGLYTFSFSVGLFRVMELAGVEASKENAEEWAKALEVAPAKVTGDLETYKLNKNKLQKAEEMIREVEIREKKKLAQRLEEKAKALAAKAAAKKDEGASTA